MLPFVNQLNGMQMSSILTQVRDLTCVRLEASTIVRFATPVVRTNLRARRRAGRRVLA